MYVVEEVNDRSLRGKNMISSSFSNTSTSSSLCQGHRQPSPFRYPFSRPLSSFQQQQIELGNKDLITIKSQFRPLRIQIRTPTLSHLILNSSSPIRFISIGTGVTRHENKKLIRVKRNGIRSQLISYRLGTRSTIKSNLFPTLKPSTNSIPHVSRSKTE